MPEQSNPNKVDFEETTSRLDEGLKSCRAVVSGYRALLGASTDGSNPGNSNEPEAATDLPDDG